MGNAIDKSVFENLKLMTGADFIGELIDTFLSDSLQQIKLMQSALKTRDVEGLRRAAHSVKSTAASFGASHLSSLAFKLEGMAKASNQKVRFVLKFTTV